MNIYELFKIHDKSVLIYNLKPKYYKDLYDLSIILIEFYKQKKWFYSFETYQNLSCIVISFKETKRYKKKILKNLTVEDIRYQINQIGLHIPSYNQAFHILKEINE